MTNLSFGLIADVQFAFAPDRTSPGKPRFYQNSKTLLGEAVAHWNNGKKSSFVVQLGDVIDSLNANLNKSRLALDAVLEEFDKSDVEVVHVLGNHELYNFNREEQLMKTPLCICHKKRTKAKQNGQIVQDFRSATPVFYFTFTVKDSPWFRFVVLDTFEESVLGRNKASQEYKHAMNVLRKHNNNEDLSVDVGLEGIDRRYVIHNGGIGFTKVMEIRFNIY
ncbi:hypothetical protein QZH41_007382 [Actinostola sp. cb2023]|nr:hypothetical protein QZH41_007382 [Actinostola sp. cb2023]